MSAPNAHLLDEALSPARVFQTREAEKDALLNFLVDRIAESGEVDDAEALRQAVFNREKLMSTGIGLGVGVPHARISTVRRMVVAAAINDRPLQDYDSIDNQPVQIVFLVAGRPDQQSNYVRLLAVLSHIVKDPDNRRRMWEAPTAEDAYQVIRQLL